MRLVRTVITSSDLHLVSYLLSMIFFFGLECVVLISMGLDLWIQPNSDKNIFLIVVHLYYIEIYFVHYS